MLPSDKQQQIVGFLNVFKEYAYNRRKLLGTLDTDPNRFNLFKVISDKYRKENLHSDILAFLLTSSPQPGQPSNLDVFFDFLDKNLRTDLRTRFGTEGEKFVLREKERIDILIHNNRDAVIIENKLNHAPDMNTQLCRYYHKVTGKLHLRVAAIIYIPLEPHKKPPIESYNCGQCQEKCPDCGKFDFEKELSELTKTLSVQPLVELLKQFTRQQDDLAVFVRHYISLLTELGANAMTINQDMEVVREIFSNPEHMNTARELAALWSRLPELLHVLVGEQLCRRLAQKGYTETADEHWHSPKKNWVKPLDNRFFKQIIYNPQWLTFALEPNRDALSQTAAQNILQQPVFGDFPYLSEVRSSAAHFKHRNFVFKTLPPVLDTFDQIVERCVQCFDRLEEQAKQFHAN